MAASLMAANVTSTRPSLLIVFLLTAQPAGDRGEALATRVLCRLVVGVCLHEAIADGAQRGIELRRVLVPPVLQRLKARRRRTLPRAHQRVEPGQQVAELGLDLRVDVVDVLSCRVHRGQLRPKIRTGTTHAHFLRSGIGAEKAWFRQGHGMPVLAYSGCFPATISCKHSGLMRLFVSVDSQSGRHDLSLPDDAPVGELLPVIVRACEGLEEVEDGWRLAPQGAGPIRPEQTLGQVGLFDGAVLVLAAPA